MGDGAAHLFAAIAVALVLAACREAPDPVALRGDALLVAPDQQVLEKRLALVEAGSYADAVNMWAERALLPPLSSSMESAEMTWRRNMASALEGQTAKGSPSRALDRLARAFERSRWVREASVVLESERTFASLSEDGERLRGVTTTLTRFAAALDSLARSRYAALDRGEVLDRDLAHEGGRQVARFGLTLDALRNRGLYLGVRPSASRFDVDEIDLAVMVGHEGPFAVRQGEAVVNTRRIILDDNLITRYRVEDAWPWEPGSVALVEDGTLIVYHDRSALRRAATLLYLALERRGGRPPADGDPLSDAPSDTSQDTRAAFALRLHSVSPVFEHARAAGGPREEIRRRFILEIMAARMAQIEAGEARRVVAERNSPGTTSGVGGARELLLRALRYGPLPGLRLADAIDSARRAPPSDIRGEAARAVLAELRRLTGGEDFLPLGEPRLRELAAAIAGDTGS